jgi:hypothetical protein
MSERARELLGFEGSRQRYPDIESVRDLEEISDPSTIEDDTQQSLREYIAENRVTAISFSLMAIVVGAAVLAFAWRYVPLVVTNPFFIASIVLAGTFLVGRRNGWRANQSRVEDIDELTLQYKDHVKVFKGLFIEGGADSPPLFVAIKGYRFPGTRPSPYTAEEVDPSLMERAEGNFDPTNPAPIRLHPEFVEWTSTATGTKVCQATSGIEPDTARKQHDGKLSVLKAAPPVRANPEEVARITKKNQELAKEKKELKEDINELESEIEDLRDRLYDPVDERVETQIDRASRLVDSARGRSSSQSDSDGRKVTSGSPDEERERTKDEVEVNGQR